MTSKRFHIIMIAILILLFISLLGGVYGINSLLTSRTDKLVTLKTKSLALAQEQLNLNQAKKDIKTYTNLDEIARAVVPQDKDQAEAVREIVNIAAANDIGLGSITFPASSLGTTAAGASSTPTSTATPAAATGLGNASANSPAAALSQLTPVPNIASVYELPITVVSNTVQYDNFINFLSALELNRRTAQVSSIIIQPSVGNHTTLTFTLSLNEYIKP